MIPRIRLQPGRVAAIALAAVLLAPPRARPAAAQEPAATGALAGAAQSLYAEMRLAERDLAAARAEVERERKPLAARSESLQSELRELRQKAEAIRRQRGETSAGREALDRQLAKLRDDCRFAREALLDYRRSAPAQSGPEGPFCIEPGLKAADALLVESSPPAAIAEAAGKLLDAALAETESALGGRIVEGEALDSRGVSQAGSFAVVGPALYFSGGDCAGPVTMEPGSLLPTVWQGFRPEQREAVRKLAGGGEVALPVDTSGTGDGLRVARARQTVREHLFSGGPVMIPLGAVGILALVTSFWKLAQLARIPTDRPAAVDRVVDLAKSDEMDGARAEADRLRAPLNRVVRAALDYKGAPREHLEEILNERILSEMPALERHLGTLAVLGAVAPLLGLLGTVTGMIHTFQLVTLFGTGDARLLSGGLSEALVTTEAGLVIAIPVLLVHAYLARRVRAIVASIERTALEVVNRIKQAPPS